MKDSLSLLVHIKSNRLIFFCWIKWEELFGIKKQCFGVQFENLTSR